MSCDLLCVFFPDCPFQKFDLKSQDNITGLKNPVKIITLPKFKLGIKQSEVVYCVDILRYKVSCLINWADLSQYFFSLYFVLRFLTNLLLITKERWRSEK